GAQRAGGPPQILRLLEGDARAPPRPRFILGRLGQRALRLLACRADRREPRELAADRLARLLVAPRLREHRRDALVDAPPLALVADARRLGHRRVEEQPGAREVVRGRVAIVLALGVV